MTTTPRRDQTVELENPVPGRPAGLLRTYATGHTVWAEEAGALTARRAPGTAQQPPIDEILASIRRIIAEDHQEIASTDDLVAFFKHQPATHETVRGMFTKDATVVRFATTPKNEEILADIWARNAAEGHGNLEIPGTNVHLVNFSACPDCGEVHSMKDLECYYFDPKPDPGLRRSMQFRRDTRVSCKECGHLFLPSLVVVDGEVDFETQMLCRVQTLDAIQRWHKDERSERVLGAKPDNLVVRPVNDDVPEDGARIAAIRNDLSIQTLAKTPDLLANFLQYTPPPQILRFTAGKLDPAEDIVFGTWFPVANTDRIERLARAG